MNKYDWDDKSVEGFERASRLAQYKAKKIQNQTRANIHSFFVVLILGAILYLITYGLIENLK